jgi:hypothetical protein
MSATSAPTALRTNEVSVQFFILLTAVVGSIAFALASAAGILSLFFRLITKLR